MAGGAPAPSPAASRCTPSGPAALSLSHSDSSTGSTEPSVPNVVRPAADKFLSYHSIHFASRSSLQLWRPTSWHSAVATS
eukprot:scaffold47345_cov55-Phaeocystis_antarctica.AAC.1